MGRELRVDGSILVFGDPHRPQRVETRRYSHETRPWGVG